MSKARILANLISDNAELADGQISVAEVVGAAPLASPAFTGTVTMDGGSTSGNFTFGDNDEIVMGTGSDLRIFHNGSNSYIQDNGTGLLIVQGSSGVHIKGRDATDMIRANEGSGVQLYHNNSVKASTTATGFDVTGTVTADGLTVDGRGAFYSGVLSEQSQLRLGYSSGFHWSLGRENATTGDLFIESHDGTDTPRLRVGSGGDVSFYDSTGTTPKFFWDASAEGLALGQTALLNNGTLTVKGEGKQAVVAQVTNNANSLIQGFNSSTALAFQVTGAGSGYFAGNVGIGTSAPRSDSGTTNLHVSDTQVARVLIESTDKSGVSWFTIGVSPNIIEASFKALIDSLDYKLFKEKAPANIKINAK
jgi:hypothetical protein